MIINRLLILISILLLMTSCLDNNVALEELEFADANSESKDPFGKETLIDGRALYKTNCASCHSPLESSSKKESGVAAIETAIASVFQMHTQELLSLKKEEILAIANALSLSPPNFFDVKPEGSHVYTNKVTLEFTTDEMALCRYDNLDKSFESMAYTFDQVELSSSHSKEMLVEGDTGYKIFVRCQDAYGNTSATSQIINFFVEKELPPELRPPVLSALMPNSNLSLIHI